MLAGCAGKDAKKQPMRLTDRSRFLDADGNLSMLNRMKGMVEFGMDWYPRMQAQNSVAQRLSKILGNHHSMLRNASIPGVDPSTTTLILISPQGIRVLMVHPERGVFRAQDEQWLAYDSKERSFKMSEPNLQTEALQVAGRVERLLKAQGLPVMGVEAILIFTNPRTLVDGLRPKVRLVAADAIDYFGANLDQTPQQMQKSDVRNITDAILKPHFPAPRSVEEFITGQPVDPEKRKRTREAAQSKPKPTSQRQPSPASAPGEQKPTMGQAPVQTPAFDLSHDSLDQLETQTDDWAWLRDLQNQTEGAEPAPSKKRPRRQTAPMSETQIPLQVEHEQPAVAQTPPTARPALQRYALIAIAVLEALILLAYLINALFKQSLL